MIYPLARRHPTHWDLLFVLRRHARRNERREAAIRRTWLPGLEFSRRGIPAGGLQNDLGRDIFPDGVDDVAVAAAEIGGTPSLRPPGGDLVIGGVGLLGELVAVGKAKGAGYPARPVVVVELFDPQVNRARIAFQRMRIHNSGLQQLEGG